MPRIPSKRIRLGIITDEHLGHSGSRKGGFGWATQQVGALFSQRAEWGVDPVILNCVRAERGTPKPDVVEGVPMLWRKEGRIGLFDFGGMRPDLLLCIDYRPNYRVAMLQLPRTPTIVWVRDPWGSVERASLADLRLPDSPEAAPAGVAPPDHTTYRQIDLQSRLCGRRLTFGITAAFLRRRVADAYAIPEPPLPILPNPLAISDQGLSRNERPTVLFLGRLDPVKRPWVAIELAKAFPEVEFVFAGQAHFSGKNTWKLESPPANCRFVGHVDGEEKRRLIASSWILLNTSIHEGLPVSIQESLACGLAQLGTLDPDGVVSRFGVFTGEFGGDGLAALPALKRGLSSLLGDPARLKSLGAQGRRWVEENHTVPSFLREFATLANKVGRPLPSEP